MKNTVRKIFVESDSDEGCSDDPMMPDTSSEYDVEIELALPNSYENLEHFSIFANRKGV